MSELLEILAVGLLWFAAGVCVGRDTLARANRRLRRERDGLLAERAGARRADPPRITVTGPHAAPPGRTP